MPEHPVFVRTDDALDEIESLLRELRLSGPAAGLHKSIYVSRARQTVVMVTARDAPLARALRGRAGWTEPGLT